MELICKRIKELIKILTCITNLYLSGVFRKAHEMPSPKIGQDVSQYFKYYIWRSVDTKIGPFIIFS